MPGVPKSQGVPITELSDRDLDALYARGTAYLRAIMSEMLRRGMFKPGYRLPPADADGAD